MKQGILSGIALAALACFVLLLGVGFVLMKKPVIEQVVRQPQPSTASGAENIPASATLDLSGRNLTAAPASVFNDASLEKLNLSHNALTGALPAEIRHLSNLRTLDASYNRMTGVPAEIGQLANLEMLDLSYNQLTGLPQELGNLQHLRVLNLAGNPHVSLQDLASIRAHLSATTRILLN